MIIAIDGPSGAGKSTVSKAVARRLGFSCLDTGAMYRSIAWQALQDGVSLEDGEALGRIADMHEIGFSHEPGDPLPRRVSISGVDVTDAIRTAEIDRSVSAVAAAPAVRQALVAQQQGIGGNTQCRRQHDDAFGIGGGFAGLPFADGLPADPQPLRQPLLRITRFFTVVCNTLSQCHIFLLSG